MIRRYAYLLFAWGVLFTLCLPAALLAQDNAESTSSDTTDIVVRRLHFKGNDSVSDGTLEMLIRTHTNREFLGIPGFTPWYYIHQLTGSFGEDPALLNYETVATDLERITRYYNSIGYLEATADSSITIYEKKKARVTFTINEGERTYIKSIGYTGIPDSAFQSQEAKIEFLRDSPLTDSQVNDSTFQADMPYMENALDTERRRIIEHLKNNGYAAVQPDSITALVKRQSENQHRLDVLYVVKPGDIYTFGDLYLSLAGPGAQDSTVYTQKDTLQGEPYTMGGQKIYLMKQPSAQSRFSLLTDQILFTPGATFNNQRYIRTINEFQNLGMVSIRQFGLSERGTGTDFSQKQIPVYFSLQTLPKHSINLNVFGLKRYGYGSGAGVTYTNNNLFGKGENLQLSLNGSFEYVGKKRLSNLPKAFSDTSAIETNSQVFQSFEARADLSLPRLTFPFNGLDDILFFSNSRTRYSLAYNQSEQLLFNINANLTFNQRYEVQHNSRLTSFLDLLQLELLDTNPSDPFEEALQREFQDNPFALNQILEDFRPQFSSIIRYTLRSQRTDLIKRDYGYFSEYSISLGGNIPYLIDRFVVTPDSIEGNIPSPVKFSENSLAYSRYVKATADYRRYFPLTNNTVFAARGFGGYAIPYGKNKTIPLNQRFYAGGSNDVRGWSLFTLGPGPIPFDEVTINGGDIKLLGQVELRQTVTRNFLSSDWILALFTDAGNVWYGPSDKIQTNQLDEPGGNDSQIRANLERGKFKLDEFYKQIAVGSGFGLRLDFEYLVARIDLAFRIHDLQDGWFQSRTPYFHFGIGHSF